MSKTAVNVLKLVAVIATAPVLSLVGWWLLVSPWAYQHVHQSAAWVFNIVPATAAFLINGGSNGHFLVATLDPCDFCSPREHLQNYLTIAIPAHTAAILVGVFAASVVRRRASRPRSVV
jgi:membrane associated rhomboid family serine protease